jgi:hypothetical protein
VGLVHLLRSSIARVAVLHGLVLAAAMIAVLSGVYIATDRLIANEGDQLISIETQNLTDSFKKMDTDAFIAAVIERADDPWIRGGVYELHGPRGNFLAGNVVVLSDLKVASGAWTEFEVADANNEADISRQIRAKVEDLGDGYRLLVGHDVQDRRAFKTVMLQSVIWAVLATLLFGVVGGWWLGRRISRTAKAISSSAARIALGNLTERLPLSGNGDEIDTLVSQFNELLTRVDTLTTTLRAVLDSTAHDLRGHLNRIRGAAQEASLKATSADEVSAVALVLTEIDRLSETLQGLLRIALAESGTVPLERVDVSAMTTDLVEFYQPVAGLEQLQTHIEPGLWVRGHRQLLTQALSNVLDNALKYGQGSQVSINLSRDEQQAILTIRDQGPGIPAEQREWAKQRFRRLPGSTGLPGSGLGLSLVAAVARLHQADLNLQDANPGLALSLSIPLTNDQTLEPTAINAA